MAKHRRSRRRGKKSAPDPSILQRSVQDATYPVTWQATGSWQDGFRDAFRHDRHRQAARAFARAYFARHGRLPTGTHHVVKPPGSGHAALEADVTFPRKVRRDPPR
jgi:hypothetical protein